MVYIYIYIYISSSSSSCRAACADIPDRLPPFLHYHPSPPVGLQGYIPCPHTAAVCRFVLVVPLLHIHVRGSTGVHRLWARPCFSSSVLLESPWLENPANTYVRQTEHWTAVSTLVGLISSAYRDLRHWRWNQQPQDAEAETLHLGHIYIYIYIYSGHTILQWYFIILLNHVTAFRARLIFHFVDSEVKWYIFFVLYNELLIMIDSTNL